MSTSVATVVILAVWDPAWRWREAVRDEAKREGDMSGAISRHAR